MIPILWNTLVRVNNPVAADRAVLRRLADEWRTGIVQRYRRLIHAAQERVESATPAQLVGIVEEVGTAAAESQDSEVPLLQSRRPGFHDAA